MKRLGYLLLIWLLSACQKDFLDRKPYDALSSENAWSSDVNATMAVNGIYHTMNLDDNMAGYFFVFSKLGPDGYDYFRDESIQRGLSTNRTPLYLTTYSGLYRIIKYTNDAIANLVDNPDLTPEVASRLMGEVKFMRGMAYFYLLQLYGGVILLEEPVDPADTYLPRNSAEEVRSSIIADFEDAIERLPISYSGGNIGRITKGAAVTMLGKTYLYNKQWSEAGEQLKQLLSPPYTYSLFADYDALFTDAHENNQEIVFSLQSVMQAGLGSFYDRWYGGRSLRSNGESKSQPSWITVFSYTHQDGSPIAVNTMPKEEDYANEVEYGAALINWYQTTFADVDVRAHGNVIIPGFTIVGNGNQTYMVNWPYTAHANDDIPAYRIEFSPYALFSWRKMIMTGDANTLRSDSPIDIPLIRFADVLLMYAEAVNEAEGPTTEVYEALRQIRERAGVEPVAPGLDQEEMRREIRLERLKEFAGEGHLFFDVRRWRTAHTDDPVFGLNHMILDFKGKDLYPRVFTEKDYLWPIPQQEIDINNNLDQNPDWE